MSKFTPTDFRVKSEKEAAGQEKPQDRTQIVKFNPASEPHIQGFQAQPLQSAGAKYAEVKAKYGSLAATDKEHALKSQKDARFALSPLLRDPLAVEEEEKRVIDEKVKARVATLSEEAKAKAVAVGYREGVKNGHDEAFAKFQEEAAERLQRFTAVLEAAESAKEQIFRANERFLIETVYRIARMVLLKELKLDREYVQRLARDLIDRVGVRENITIRISDDDAETVGMLKEGLEKSLGSLKNLNIQISNQVKGGGCIVETEWNAIDASIETQLQGLYDALIGGANKDGQA